MVFLGEQNNSKSINTNMIGFKQPNFFLKIFFCLISLIKLNPIQFGIFFHNNLKNISKIMLINTTFYFFTTYGHLNSFLKIFMAKLF